MSLETSRRWTRAVAFVGFVSAAFSMALFLACSSSSTPTPPSDAGTDVRHDGGAAKDAGVGLTCSKLLQCDQACSSNSCTNDCYADSTAVAQGLFTVFDDCLDVQCPSSAGGPCSSSSSTACSNCNQQAATGGCISQLVSCEGDTHEGPPNGDGGVVLPDAGSIYNCGELNTCVAGCPSKGGAACSAACASEATPTAQSLFATLNKCLAKACPAADGGPCAMAGAACMGCIEQVTLAEPDTCATPYIACNQDRSNEKDGGAVTVLVDGGVLSTVLTGLDQAASTILVSGDYLYFTQVVGGGPVYRLWVGDGGTIGDGGLAFGDGGALLMGDGGPLMTVGPPQATPVSLAVDTNNVYVWSVGTFGLSSSINNHDGTVVQIPLDGQPPITLNDKMEVLYDAAYLNAIAIDSRYVYWVAGASGSDGAIMRSPIGGGSSTAIYSGQQIPQAVVTDGTSVYWADWGTFDSEGRSNNDGTLWQGPVDGGTPIKLASNQEAPSAIAIDTKNVYWVNLGKLGADNFPALNSGSVMNVPIGGGKVTTVANKQAVPVSIVIAGETVYWSEYGLSAPGLLMSAPTKGGPPAPLVTNLYDPAALAISGNTLYWTNANSSPTNGYIQSLRPF
jgi:hypothetical protein